MAEHMQDIKRRIRSVESTGRITGAMKLVSASKLRMARSRYEHSRAYLERLTDSVRDAFADAGAVPDAYILGWREIHRTCFVIITSSSGLCGSFNGDVIRAAQDIIDGCEHEKVLMCIGSRGEEYFRRRGYTLSDSASDAGALLEDRSFREIQKLTGPLGRQYLDGEIDEIVFIYTHYVNPLVQKVVSQRLLPVDIKKLRRDVRESYGDTGAYRHIIEYDPDPDTLFRYQMERYVQLRLYGAVMESVTCEHAARRQAMESASDNASDLLGRLRTSYNRVRQSRITDEIIEIVSGAEAMK